MFKKMLAVVLSVLGKEALAKTDGKSSLTQEEKQTLTETYGAKFVEKFEADLAAYESSENNADRSAEIEAEKTKYIQLKAQFDALKVADAAKQGMIDLLSSQAEDDRPETVQVNGAGKPAFKPNMAFTHNKVLEAYFRGDTSMMYSGSDTINTAELKEEFGLYVTGIKLDIYKQLTTGLTITKYMTPITTDKTEWRAMQSIITSVLQQFTPKWTPLGKTTFTPIVIKNYFHKVNLPITPSDIIDQYIGYMYNENITRDQMPIVKYIVDQLLLPKLEEDLEFAFVNGKFEEFNPTTDGTAAPAGSELKSMDGVLTILNALKAKSDTKVTFLLPGITLTRANIVDQIEIALDNIAPLYRKKRMLIHADPDLIKLYSRAYRDKYKDTKNEDGEQVRVDFTNFSFAPVEGMIGTGVFFLTPKENWIHLLSRNPNEAKIFIQVENYDVKIFMEFRMSTGFAIEEAIFAYLPPEAGSGVAGSTGGGI